MRYPINFVVKHPRSSLLAKEPSPEAHETCPLSRTCFWIAVTFSMAAIQKQRMRLGGADRDRTGDLMLAKHALSQLSYSPTSFQLSVVSYQLSC